MKKFRLFALLMALVVSLSGWCYDFQVNGICYNVISDTNVEVTSGINYNKDIIIPSQVTYGGITYNVTRIGDDAFKSTGIFSITIPEGIESIGYMGIYNCSHISTIKLPASLINLAKYALSWNTHVTSINVAEGNPRYKSVDGVLYDMLDNKIVCYPAAKTNKSYTILSGTKSIGNDAFSGAEHLREIIIPEGVEEIQDFAFSTYSNPYCMGKNNTLNHLEFPASLKVIGANSLRGENLRSIVFNSPVPPIVDGEKGKGVIWSTIYVPNGSWDSYYNAFYRLGLDDATICDGIVMTNGTNFTKNGYSYVVVDAVNKKVAVDEYLGNDRRTPKDSPASVTMGDETYSVIYPNIKYLKNVATGKYFAIGGKWDAINVLKDQAQAFNIIPTGDDTYVIESQVKAHAGANRKYGRFLKLSNENTSYIYNDFDIAYWNIRKNGEHYNISINENYLGYIGNTVTATFNANDVEAQWDLLSYDEMKATLENSVGAKAVDATFLLPNADFKRNAADVSWLFNAGNYNVSGTENEINCNYAAESWSCDFDIYQTLTNIPNGWYKIDVQGYHRHGSRVSSASARANGNEQLVAYLYANDKQVPMMSIFDDAQNVKLTNSFVQSQFGYTPDNMSDASLCFLMGLYDKNSLFVNVTDGTLRLGVKESKDDLTFEDWTIFDNFRLTYYKTLSEYEETDKEGYITTVPLVENGSLCITDKNLSSVKIPVETELKTLTYSRIFSNNKWQALYVPFSMSYDDWKATYEIAYINDVNMYDTDDDGFIDDTEIELIKIKRGSILPNNPYFIKAKNTGEINLNLLNVKVYPTAENSIECSTTSTRYVFTGTYTGVSGKEMYENQYYAMSGGVLCTASNSLVFLAPFRWYMKIESKGANQVILPSSENVRIRVVGEETDDEEATGIADISESANDKIYTLDGRSVNGDNLKAGIYIKNGKKIIVK